MRTGRAGNFVAAINCRGQPMVLNWGLPMEALFVVAALQAEGVRTWWFRGQRDQAQRDLLSANRKSLKLKEFLWSALTDKWTRSTDIGCSSNAYSASA